MLNRSPTYCVEPNERHVESHAQFDVFWFPEDKQHLSETVAKATLFYLKWLLLSVNPSTIFEILTLIERFRFPTLNTKHVKECLNWIVEHSIASYEQQLYLCIVLSHLDNSSSPLPFPNDKKTAEACDRLLQCLNACVDSRYLSRSNIERLKKIAIILVGNSNSKGWLTLAAHFYPYLGIEFILNTRYPKCLNYTYGMTEYTRMVATLLSNITIKHNMHDQIAHQHLLYQVLVSAPTLDAALELFESPDVCRFFTNEDEKVGFFVKFCQSNTRGTSAQTESVGTKLIEFYHIPAKIRGRMHKLLFSTLLDYARSDDELNGEHVTIFLKSINSGKYLDMKQVLEVLMALSKSKSVPRQNLLLEILHKELTEYWHKTSLTQKQEICESWVITRVVNKSRTNHSLVGVDKIGQFMKQSMR